ncbi:hypothetical protein [Paucisalibacillus globulus]|uniref:hypothetical protein n=1 Tax=Paucisalibacillus globulus TaxID=351095 RepID=UPI000BB9AEE1|nr:hypothetical protein [Paucisalibacillus globulus]
MKRNKIIYIIAGFLMIVVLVMGYFNVSFSLPTTFKEMVEKQIIQDEQLVMTNLDMERIASIRIEVPFSGEEEVRIKDKDVISTLLHHELRIYNGGRYKESNDEFDLYIRFYGSTHRYTIAKEYIKTDDGNYIVLDDKNSLFEYMETLYEGK